MELFDQTNDIKLKSMFKAGMIGRKRLKASELKKLEGSAFTSAAEYQYTWKGHAFFSNGGGAVGAMP